MAITYKDLSSGSTPPKENPYGFYNTGQAGIGAMIPWYNQQTGQWYEASGGGIANPDPNWSPVFGAQMGVLPENWTPPTQPAQPNQKGKGMPSSIQQPIDARYQNLLSQAGQQAINPTLPTGAAVRGIQIEGIQPGELQTAPLIDAPQQVTQQTIDPDAFVSDIPLEQDAAQFTGATAREVAPTAAETTAVLGQVNVEDIIGDVQGTLSSGALATAQTEALDEKATVQFQLGQLYEALDDGTQLPPWAAPVARKADQFMLQRGLGSSSMAAAARTQALFESALPIAAADADKYASIQLQNLNNKQTTALKNAAEIATMDRQNLDVRLKSAQQNAASFLQMNTTNVTNEQTANNLNHQARMQELFSDVASLNAARNFNAQSQNQVDQFYATLGNQVEQANKARQLATEQFNVQTGTSIQQFNAGLDQERNKFNATMQEAIDRSNTLWRRQVTTVNNQIANAVEQRNAQNLLAISEARQNQLWQAYRDEAMWANQAFENEETRKQNLALSALSFNQSKELADIEQDNQLSGLLGGFGVNFLGETLKSDWFKGLFSSPSSSSGKRIEPSTFFNVPNSGSAGFGSGAEIKLT
tara:strand:+ start:63 stop:1826 length:1764 start_codon:yes stop_codon:yes gene_type:complete